MTFGWRFNYPAEKIDVKLNAPNCIPGKEKSPMLRHVGINVRDLRKAKGYYDIFMPLLGFESHIAAEDQFAYRPLNYGLGASHYFSPSFELSTYSRHRT